VERERCACAQTLRVPRPSRLASEEAVGVLVDPRAGGEVRGRERSCARTECSEGAQGSGRLGSVESRLSRGMGLAFGERAVALLAMVGRFAAMPRRRHRDLVLGRVQRRGPTSQPAGQLRGVDGDGGHPDVPSCEVLTVAAVVQTCCEAATAAQDGVNGW
jgi:hypothetical protein